MGAEADPQLLLAAGAAPYVNDGPVAGPLTPAFGDAVQTPRGLASIALEGFSEDVNQDGFVDPIAPAVPVVAPQLLLWSTLLLLSTPPQLSKLPQSLLPLLPQLSRLLRLPPQLSKLPQLSSHSTPSPPQLPFH